MTRNSESKEVAVIALPREDDRFDQISIFLHWLTALLIVVQFVSIWAREAVDHQSDLAAALLTLHRSMGLSTWIVVVVVGWWLVGLFVLTGPDYHGPVPAGMREIKVRTELAVVAR